MITTTRKRNYFLNKILGKSTSDSNSKKTKDSSKKLYLTLSDYKLLNFHYNINIHTLIKLSLRPALNSIPCFCVNGKKWLYRYDGKSILKNRCINCDYIPNRKLVITLFTMTSSKENDEESTEKIKAMTDCTLFVGGFTGKKRSSYFLVGNSNDKNYNKEVDMEEKKRIRARCFDINGFCVVEEEGMQGVFY